MAEIRVVQSCMGLSQGKVCFLPSLWALLVKKRGHLFGGWWFGGVRCGGVVVWWFGGVRCSSVAAWQFGGVAVWQFGGVWCGSVGVAVGAAWRLVQSSGIWCGMAGFGVVGIDKLWVCESS